MSAMAVIEPVVAGDKHCDRTPLGVDSPVMRHIRLRSVLMTAPLVMGCLAGCRDERRHQASEISELEVATNVVPANAAPAEVAQALLIRLARAQTARERGLGIEKNRDEYRKTMAEVRGLAARKLIYETFRGRGGSSVPVDLKEEGAVRTVTDSWVSICAYYAGALETAALSTAMVDAKSATVFADVVAPIDAVPSGSAAAVPATVPTIDDAERKERVRNGRSPRPETRIVCRLTLDESNAWRVVRVELESVTTSTVGRAIPSTPITATQAVTQPAR